MKDWQSQAHVKWECKYHVVIVPKYRKKALYGRLRGEIGKIIRELCRQKGIELVEGKAMPDHVHMLLSVPPRFSIVMTVGYLKGKSAHKLLAEYQHLRKRYWCLAFVEQRLLGLFERQCDGDALRLTGNRAAFRGAFQRLGKLNLEDLDPPTWEVIFFHDHPPLGQRIAMADEPTR